MKKIVISGLAAAASIVGFGLTADAGAYPPGAYPPAVPDPGGELPVTGSDGTQTLLFVAAGLLGAGGIVTMSTRSRRQV